LLWARKRKREAIKGERGDPELKRKGFPNGNGRNLAQRGGGQLDPGEKKKALLSQGERGKNLVGRTWTKGRNFNKEKQSADFQQQPQKRKLGGSKDNPKGIA